MQLKALNLDCLHELLSPRIYGYLMNPFFYYLQGKKTKSDI